MEWGEDELLKEQDDILLIVADRIGLIARDLRGLMSSSEICLCL